MPRVDPASIVAQSEDAVNDFEVYMREEVTVWVHGYERCAI